MIHLASGHQKLCYVYQIEMNIIGETCTPHQQHSRKKQCKHHEITVKKVMKSQNGLGWNGPYRSSRFQPLCHGQDCQPPDHVAHSPIHPGLEHVQRWGTYSSSGQPVLVPPHPHSEEFFPNLNLSSFSLKLLPLVLSLYSLTNHSPTSL